MIDGLTFIRETRRPVRHDAFALRRADRGAEIGLAREAGFTLAAFGRVERNDMVAHSEGFHALPNFAHNACAFMAKDTGEQALTIQTVQCVRIRMANPCRHNFNQYFACFGTLQIDFDDFERFIGGKSNGGAGFDCIGHSLAPQFGASLSLQS